MIELENMLQDLSGSYKDFVKWVLHIAEDYDGLDKIKSYLTDNPNVNDEDVLHFIDDNFDIVYNDDEIPEWAQDDED